MVDEKQKKKRRAKRPPPTVRPKRVPMRGTLEVQDALKTVGRPSKTKVQVPEEAPTATWLRVVACNAYKTDPEGRSVMWHYENDDRFHVVSVDTFRRWAAVDGWTEQRRRFRERFHKVAEDKILSALVRARLGELQKQEQLLDTTLQKLLPEEAANALECKSYEGVLNAYTRLAKDTDEMREKLADVMMPGVLAAPVTEGSPRPKPMLQPHLDEDEKRAAASVILKLRREKHRAALRAEEAEARGEEPAPLRVIEGDK